MGRLLQIRVSAWTFSEDDVEKTWPRLWNLVWPEPKVIPYKGVMELTEAVFDGARAGLLTKEVREALGEKADQAEALRQEIETALVDRDPRKADKLTYELEDCLDALEDIADNF